MENNENIIHVIPDTPMSVLELFSASKDSINQFAAKIINDVEDGNIDPLRVKVLCKTMEKIIEKIDEGTKQHQKREADKWGEKPFEFMGAEIHQTVTSTRYDYEATGDPEWQELSKKLKQREEWLRTMGVPETIVVRSTGEIKEIFPPIKKTTTGLKITIR